MARYDSALSFDLRRYFGLRLSDIATTRFTWREFGDFVANLPRESALSRALAREQEEEEGDSQWGLSEQLLASVVDMLAIMLWRESKNARESNRPQPVPRPGVRPQRYGKIKMDVAAAEEFLSRRRLGQGRKE